MSASYLGGVAPDARADGPVKAQAERTFGDFTAAMDRLDFPGACTAVWDLIRTTNAFIEDSQPWALNKAGDTAAVAGVLGDCLEALRLIALLAAPVMPRATAELWRRLGLETTPQEQRLPDAAAWGQMPAGATLEKGAPLFPRIDTSET
jgi:methionyl-tRNA synthetase